MRSVQYLVCDAAAVRLLALLAAAGGAGCITPRSMTVGMTAAPVGRGATEVGVFGGVSYASQTNPIFRTETASTQTEGRAFAAPGAEANVQYGFTDQIGLNVHASPAGVQPGLKWTLTQSKYVHLSVLPAVGLGYASYSQTISSAGENDELVPGAPTTTTSFTFLGGVKMLFSHRAGFYAAVGYDFLLNRSLASSERGTSATGERTETLTTTTMHQVSAALGFDVTLGMVHLRPEIAFAVYPGIAATATTRVPPDETRVSGRGGFGFAILPGFSLAMASPARELTDDEREEQRAKARRPRRSDPEGEEDDELRDDDRPAPRKSRPRPSVDDEDAPRPKRPPIDDDDLRD